jgi:hypothetical protein
MRTLIGSIDNWPLLYKRAFNAIKPGGYIEDSETDIVCTSSISLKFANWQIEHLNLYRSILLILTHISYIADYV